MKKRSIASAILSIVMAFIMVFSPLGIGAVGIEASAASSKSSTSSVAKPSKVSSISYSSTSNSVKLKWGKVKNAKGYRIYRLSGKKWKTVATIKDAKTTSYTVKNLKASTTYSFKIKAYNQKGKVTKWSADSKVIKCKTKVNTKVKISSTSATNTSVTLKWGKISGAKGYRVYRKVDGKWKTVATVSGTSYTVKNLKASTSYTFCVRAYKKSNNKTTWYEMSKAVTVKTAASKASIISSYNKAVNNAKKLKNGTITFTSSMSMKCTDCSAKYMISIINTALKSFSSDTSKSTFKLKNGVDKSSGATANQIIEPYGETVKLKESQVSSATKKKTDSGSVITVKLKKETATFNGKTYKPAPGHENVINGGFSVGDFEGTGLEIKSMKVTHSGATVTATLDSKGRLTKLSINDPETISIATIFSDISLSMVLSCAVKDTYQIKY